MIGWETLLIISIAGIFAILLRRLPSAIRETRAEDVLVDSAQKTLAREPVQDQPVIEEIKEEEPEPLVLSSATHQTDDDVSAQEADQLYQAKDYAQAVHAYEQLVANDPSNPQYYHRLGVIYLELERFHDAREVLRTALKFGDQVASRHANLAMAEYALGHRLTAVRYIKRAIALAPDVKKYQVLLETFENERG